MNVLLTSVILESGLMTHVWDLAVQLKKNNINVIVAILEIEKGKRKTIYSHLKTLDDYEIPYQLYKSARDLNEIAISNNINLIHAHSRLNFPSSRLVSKRLNIPLIVTIHGTYQWKKYNKTLRHAKSIIAIGPAQAKSSGFASANKLKIIENGIDINKFRPNNSAFPERPTNYFYQTIGVDQPLRIIWFGRSNGPTSNGIKALNQAVKLLRQQGKNIELIMIGRNQAMGIDQFDVIGWVDNPIPYLQWSDIAFGHGRSLREAMSCGNVGFLLGDGYGGIITSRWFNKKVQRPLSAIQEYHLPKPNAQRIARELSILYDKRNLLKAHRNQARTIAVKYFNVDMMVRKTIDVYKKALSLK